MDNHNFKELHDLGKYINELWQLSDIYGFRLPVVGALFVILRALINTIKEDRQEPNIIATNQRITLLQALKYFLFCVIEVVFIIVVIIFLTIFMDSIAIPHQLQLIIAIGVGWGGYPQVIFILDLIKSKALKLLTNQIERIEANKQNEIKSLKINRIHKAKNVKLYQAKNKNYRRESKEENKAKEDKEEKEEADKPP